jgi:hypothetical protein
MVGAQLRRPGRSHALLNTAEWLRLYELAVLEIDSHRVRMLVEEAREAIGRRLTNGVALATSEREFIVKALRALSALEKERCGLDGDGGTFTRSDASPYLN